MCCLLFYFFLLISLVGFIIKKNSNINILIVSDKFGIKYVVKVLVNLIIKEVIVEFWMFFNLLIIIIIKVKIVYCMFILVKIMFEYGVNKNFFKVVIFVFNKKMKENIVFILILSVWIIFLFIIFVWIIRFIFVFLSNSSSVM